MHISNWEWNRWNRSLHWQKACPTAKLRHSPISMIMDSRLTQRCVPMVMTITGVSCMNEAGRSRRLCRNWYMSEGQQTYGLALSRGACELTECTQALVQLSANFEMSWHTLVESLSATFSQISDELSSSSTLSFPFQLDAFYDYQPIAVVLADFVRTKEKNSCSLSLIDTWYCLSSSSSRRFTKDNSCHFSLDDIAWTVDIWGVEAISSDLCEWCFLRLTRDIRPVFRYSCFWSSCFVRAWGCLRPSFL